MVSLSQAHLPKDGVKDLGTENLSPLKLAPPSVLGVTIPKLISIALI